MPDARVTVLVDEPQGTISPLLHGHFIEHLGRCCGEGLWVGPDSSIPNTGGFRTDVVSALARLGVPIMRWPGGCYADTYHWRDGIGPRHQRPRTLGESCGLRVVEDNGFGTHEFVDLCRTVGAEPYLAGNLGSGTPQEMMDWLHYCNGTLDTSLTRERARNGHPEPMKIRFWGVGNENWGCGGNFDPVDYAKEFRRYATFLRMADSDTELVACGDNKREWNLRVLESLTDDLRFLDHLSVHQYYKAGPATSFSEEEHYRLMRAGDLVEDVLSFTSEVLRYFSAGKREVKIAFDEWGVWHPEAQKNSGYEAPNTLRDAVAAAGVLDTFHRHCRSLSMANLAQTVNVLQCLVQTKEDRCWLTPTYHLFDLYRPHRGGVSVRCVTECISVEVGALEHLPSGLLPTVSATASIGSDSITVSVTNRSFQSPLEIELAIPGSSRSQCHVKTLAADAPDAVNSEERPDWVAITQSSGSLPQCIVLPPCSVQTIVIS